jgi:ribose 5-phosphate isomerase B
MKIVIASDHAGYETKQKIIETFKNKFEFVDYGPNNEERTDYPDYADKVAQYVARGSGDLGILVCGSGQGMAMRANKYPQIRAALCWDEESAQLSRAHNDANVLCVGGRLLKLELVYKIITMFFATPFEGGRHADRVKKIAAIVK